MADPELVDRLRRSVTEWNRWRQEHPEVRPDLGNANLDSVDISSADLRDTNLSHANLRDVKLREAKLRGAKLRYAKLSGANLNGANFRDVKLRGADLRYANLSTVDLRDTDLTGANLMGADLMGADLRGVNLSGTDPSYANFSQTYFNRTVFAWVDLSLVKGLKAAIHQGPSSVDINSVTLPHDQTTRLHFLRGVGFTETQIEYLPSLLTPLPIEYVSLFISYAHQDEAVAKRLYTDLRKKDVPCWFAPHDLRPGTPILRGIEEAIHKQDKFLLILSEHAVRSTWIEREVDAALHQEIKRGQDVLFPIRLDNAILESHAGWAARLQHRHIGDFTGWQDESTYQNAVSQLLRHLKVAKL